MRLIRNLLLLSAFVVAWVLALLQLGRLGGHASTERWSAKKRTLNVSRLDMKRWGLRIAVFLIVAALGGFLFAASGIMSIKASSGHWAVTAWILNFTMRRSVTTHALTIDAPSLDDQALVLKGAGHYETGCRPCHGGPDLPQQPRIAEWMTPHPPNLSQEVPKWDPNELFYIVKHGVKFTGMPAWPAQKRDDEVWAMVAFLLTLPGLTGDDYKRLVQGGESQAEGDPPMHDLLEPQQVPRAVIESCGRCHGLDGSGRGAGAFPKLAGQKPEYFTASMQAYALGRRSSGIMEPIALALSQESTAELARYYATVEGKPLADGTAPPTKRVEAPDQKLAQASNEPATIENREVSEPPRTEGVKSEPASAEVKARPGSFFAAAAKPGLGAVAGSKNRDPQSISAIDRGRQIAMHGIPKQRVPACAECHGPAEIRRNPHYPILAGQYADYLVLQLTLFQNQASGGTAYAHLMRPVAAGLRPEQMRDVALFYESLGN
ncbi:MAG TPA: c-type cytochrome [Candidatus Binatia bacterium]|nr:c-type cytochrome [Candidatus Binatia bacterium]